MINQGIKDKGEQIKPAPIQARQHDPGGGGGEVVCVEFFLHLNCNFLALGHIFPGGATAPLVTALWEMHWEKMYDNSMKITKFISIVEISVTNS